MTALSQQFRAFNLVWALFAEGRLGPGDRVGIVGGGIGGLTAAAAAMLMRCRVVLAEERPQLMHLQRGNTTRLLHPNIYEWPSPRAEEDSTRFPCMNWTADSAGEVVSRLDREWAAVRERYHPEVHTDTRVTAIEPLGPAGRLVLCAGGDWRSDPCDAVIVAVGFGVEGPVPGLPPVSYWENDSLGQPARGGLAVRRVLVSGIGDGGCIDVLRLKYADFQHAKFANTVARLGELERYKKPLLYVENRIPGDGAGDYLREQYQRLGLPADLAERLGTLRSDTHVVFNGPDPSPLSPNACVLHRLAIWALVVGNKINYSPGRIDPAGITSEPAPSGVRHWVPIPGTGRHAFDAVIIRHGPRGCLAALPGVADGYTGITEAAPRDKTRGQMYPDDFYPARVVDDRMSPAPAPHFTPAAADAAFPTERTEPSTAAGDSVFTSAAAFSPAPAGPVRVSVLDRPLGADLAVIESLTGRLVAATRAENYVPGVEAANALDTLLAVTGAAVPQDLWVRSHLILFDFELFVRRRVESGDGRYDVGRLRDIVRRMRREPA